jgi:TolB-like protein
MQTESANEVFRFGGFTLDLRKGVLQRRDEAALLRPKAQAVITHLARNMGRVVPKAELMDTVWPGIYVTEDSLTQSIREIRKALGDDKQELVRTISRRGYMLAAAPAEPAAEIGAQPVVAVLRFRNDTGDAAQVPLVDGFAEDIIDGLARFRTVAVLARNSSFSIGSDSPQDWALARSRIGADYLVEGAVRRAEGRIRVSASLIDAASLAQLWGERYDAESADIFAIMDDIVARILGALVTRLDDVGASRARRKPAAALAAYDLVLRGVALMRGNAPVDFGAARDFFAAALAKDPAYGLAYAYLAFVRVMISGFGRSSREELAEALPVAMRATALSPDLPTGHRVVSFIRMYQREYASAEHHLRRALELNPCDPESVAQMGYLLTLRGRPLEALGWMDRARRLSPIHPPWYEHDRSFALYCLGDYRGAAALIEQTPVPPAWMRAWLAACYAQLGEMETARLHAAKINDTDPAFSAISFAKNNGAAFEHASDNQHFAEGVYLALGAEAPG